MAFSSFGNVCSDYRIVSAKIRLNWKIAQWIAKLTPHSRVCPPITDLSRQKIRLTLRKNATRTTTTIHYDLALLNNKDIRDKFGIELKNKFDALQEKTETLTLNDEYKNFINAHIEAAAKFIPTKHRTKSRVPWETLTVREKRADVKNCLHMQ